MYRRSGLIISLDHEQGLRYDASMATLPLQCQCWCHDGPCVPARLRGCASCAVTLCKCENGDGCLVALGLCGCMLVRSSAVCLPPFILLSPPRYRVSGTPARQRLCNCLAHQTSPLTQWRFHVSQICKRLQIKTVCVCCSSAYVSLVPFHGSVYSNYVVTKAWRRCRWMDVWVDCSYSCLSCAIALHVSARPPKLCLCSTTEWLVGTACGHYFQTSWRVTPRRPSTTGSSLLFRPLPRQLLQLWTM